MLSAGRVLKSIGVRNHLLAGVRSLALGLNEKPAYARENTNVYKRQLKNELEKLESNTRRFGRIDPILFNRCLRTIHDEHLTTKESLILLKCCGPLMFNQKKEQRVEYIDKLWDILKKKKVPLDVMHYNLLIKMYTANNHKFDPMDLVNEMKSAGIQPNHRTYEFMVNKYCLDGDLEKVTKTLEQMNEEGQSLTAPMFDSLILAYFINQDVAQALATFEMMKESNIAITNSTYKNIIIGHLNSYDSSSTLDSIKQLINENSIKFEITEATSIIEQITPNVPHEQAVELKQLLIDNLKETVGFFNELSNCCYMLILQNEHDLVKMLFDKFLTDEQTQSFFAKRLTVSILKSDESRIADFILFLKKLVPTFNFSYYTKGTIMSDEFELEKSLQLLDELASTLDQNEFGVYVYLVGKCTDMEQLHLLTERYLANLDSNWISHIKRRFIPSLQNVDLFEFMEEQTKRNGHPRSIMLLETALFCHFLDQMEIDLLYRFHEQFKPNIRLCSPNYLMTRAENVLDFKADKFNEFVKCITPKIASNQTFSADFIRLCLARLNDDQLKAVLEIYEAACIQLKPIEFRIENSEWERLCTVGRQVFKSDFEKLQDKLVKGEQIKIDEQLEMLRETMQLRDLNNLILLAIRNRNYEVASFFLYTDFKFSKGSLIKYLRLMLKAGHNPEQGIEFFELHFDDMPSIELLELRKEINEIFEHIKHNEDLVYRFIDKISLLIKPESLANHLIKFYSETKNEQIGRKIIDLNIFLRAKIKNNPTFSTMVAFIESRNTTLLQELSNRLIKQTDLGRSEVYDRLAIAYVYAKRFKQAIKVIETSEFRINEHILHPLFDHLIAKGRKEVIKQFSILVYQNSSKRKPLLKFLHNYCDSKEPELFEEILKDIKNLNASTQQSSAADKQATASSAPSQRPAVPTKKPADESIDLIQRKESKQEIIELADQRIKKQKELKINVECDLIDKLIQFGELDKATELVYDMLVNERYPAPPVIKNFYKTLNINGKVAAIDRLDPYVPKQLKESEFYRNNKAIAYLRTVDSNEEIKKCLQSVEIFSLDLIDQALTIKPAYEQQIIDLLRAKKKSNLCFVWLHFMQNAKYDKALNLVANSGDDLNVRNLLFQPLVNTAKQTGNLELASRLVNYAARFDLRTDTVQSIYGAYVKLCLTAGKVSEAERAVRDHYGSKPDIKLNLQTLNPELIAKFDKAFISEFVHK